MPYIDKEKRTKFDSFVASMDMLDIAGPGELNYFITLLTHKYLNQRPESYGMYNDVVGALESAKLELYRRHIASYEDLKIRNNGDV